MAGFLLFWPEMNYWLKLIICAVILVGAAALPAFGITKLSGWFEVLEGLLVLATPFALYFLFELAGKEAK